MNSNLLDSIFNQPKSILNYYYSNQIYYSEINKVAAVVDTSISGCTNSLPANNLGNCE